MCEIDPIKAQDDALLTMARSRCAATSRSTSSASKSRARTWRALTTRRTVFEMSSHIPRMKALLDLSWVTVTVASVTVAGGASRSMHDVGYKTW